MNLEFELHPEFKKQRETILKQYSTHTDYLSKNVFNEFISTMTGEVKKAIFEEVQHTRFFSVIADECKDISNFEQLSLCLRFLVGARPVERFYTFVYLAMDSYTAEDIVKEIKILVEDLVKMTSMLNPF